MATKELKSMVCNEDQTMNATLQFNIKPEYNLMVTIKKIKGPKSVSTACPDELQTSKTISIVTNFHSSCATRTTYRSSCF